MLGIAEVGAAIAGIKTGIDTLKLAVEAKNEFAVREAIVELQEKLLQAQSAAFEDKRQLMELLDEVSRLKAELAQQGAWDQIAKNYKLTDYGSGRVAYDYVGDAQTFHRLCVTCFDKEEKSTLQTVNEHSGGLSVFCKRCDKKTILRGFPPAKVVTRGNRKNWFG